MESRHNKMLVKKVLIIGVLIAILSYLFHPGVGQFSLMINGEPVAAPFGNFAAITTFFVMIVISGLLSLLLFMGVGALLFLAAALFAAILCLIIAPYFWPVLLIMFLLIALLGSGNGKQ